MKKFLLSMATLALSLSAFAGVGTEADPMTVADVIAGGSEGSYPDTYVTGYIVGYLPSGQGVSLNNAVFSASGAPETNILLADASAEDEAGMCIAIQLPSGSVRTALNLSIHPNNLGHKVTLCGTREKYFGAPGLKSVTSYTWIGNPPIDDPVQSLGTKEAPVSVAELIAAPCNGAPTWVKGVVVGSIPGMNLSEAVFSAAGGSTTNIIIAENADVKDVALCVPVAIPAGNLRDVLTLGNNPDLLGMEVILYGSHDKYFGAPGLKNVTEYVLNGQGGGGTTTTTTVWKSLTATDAECDWTFENTEMAEGLEYVWSWKTYNNLSYLNGSSYLNTPHAAVAYAVSPAVTLPEGELTVSFEHAAKFQTNLRTDDKFLIREEGATEWTELEIPTWPEAGAWTFVNCGNIDITAYAGKKVQFGLKYVGTDNAADTWEIRNLEVKSGDNGGTIVTPPTPTPTAFWKSLTATDATCDWTFENTEMAEGLEYVWSWKTYNNLSYLNGSSYLNTPHAAVAYAVSPVVKLTDGEFSVSFEHAAKFQTNLRTDDKFLIREEGATEWTELEIPTWPEAGAWTFVNCGNIDITAYAGKNVQFGFKYVGTDNSADTWEIRNLVITKSSGVEGIAVEEGTAIWFDLNGNRVVNPEKGLYIKVVGSKATKVIVK